MSYNAVTGRSKDSGNSGLGSLDPLVAPVVLHPSIMFIVKRLIIWAICVVVGGAM
jgi:hypothetical protein